jgi:uncharacterized protein (DUF983 family)
VDGLSEKWPPDMKPEEAVTPMPGWPIALARGLAMHCPACGETSAFEGFIAIRKSCPHCGAPLGRVRLELLPSYLTIVIGLGVMGTVMFLVERWTHLSLEPFVAIFIPVCILFELLLARPVRGLVLAVMLKMNVLRAPDEVPLAG